MLWRVQGDVRGATKEASRRNPLTNKGARDVSQAAYEGSFPFARSSFKGLNFGGSCSKLAF